jgi:hypothetical protein
MTIMSPRTVEAVYEHGLLRPLEPIQNRSNQVYLVTIPNLEAWRAPQPAQPNGSLRGKYRGYLSSADEFARNKQGGAG